MTEDLEAKRDVALDRLRRVRDALLELAKAAIDAELSVNDLLVSTTTAPERQIAPSGRLERSQEEIDASRDHLGAWIRRERLRLRMTQTELGKALGFSGPSTISHWEGGVGKPSTAQVQKLKGLFAALEPFPGRPTVGNRNREGHPNANAAGPHGRREGGPA